MNKPVNTIAVALLSLYEGLDQPGQIIFKDSLNRALSDDPSVGQPTAISRVEEAVLKGLRSAYAVHQNPLY